MSPRTFISINIKDSETLNNLRDTQRLLKSTGADIKTVEPENIHFTLKFLGEIPDNKVPEVKEKINEISFNQITLKIEDVGVFPNLGRPRVIWAGVKGETNHLRQVFTELEETLEKIGFKKERRRFNPHLTIGRVRSGKNRAELVNELIKLQNTVYGEVKVSYISFMKSELTRHGPIYTELATSNHNTSDKS
jgi:2'-5' RNA ligase